MPLQKATVPDWTTSMGNGADSVADTPRVQGPLRPEGAGRVTTSGTRGSEGLADGVVLGVDTSSVCPAGSSVDGNRIAAVTRVT
jgi:hypothetical protein